MRALALIGVVAAAGCEKKVNEEYCIKHGDDPAYAAYCHGDASTRHAANTCASCATKEHITLLDTAGCSGAVGTICCGRFTGGGNTVKDAVCLQLSDCMANM